MSPAETAQFDSYLASATRYAEFGAGGSTWRAGTFANIRFVVSVESSAAWAAVAARGCPPPRCDVRVVDVGPTGAYGFPAGDGARARWPNYSAALAAADADEPFDLVLVDGRFRVASAARTLRAHPRARLLVHDFHREAYEPIRRVAHVLESTGTLALLRRRDDATDEDLDALAEAFQFDPA